MWVWGGIISYTGLHTLVKLQCRRGFYVDRRLRGITLLMGIFVCRRFGMELLE